MKMAYIATNPKTEDCYAICSADPDFIVDACKEIKEWKKDGAVVELLPADIAKNKFMNSFPKSSTHNITNKFSRPANCAGWLIKTLGEGFNEVKNMPKFINVSDVTGQVQSISSQIKLRN